MPSLTHASKRSAEVVPTALSAVPPVRRHADVLQRALGNRAVQELVETGTLETSRHMNPALLWAFAGISPRVQRKVMVGAVDDPAERESDRVADAIMRDGAVSDPGSVAASMRNKVGRDTSPGYTAAFAGKNDAAKRPYYFVSQGAINESPFAPEPSSSLIQRQCACGGLQSDECADCKQNRGSLQPRALNEMQVDVAPPAEMLKSPKDCLDECEKQFNKCLEHSKFPPECISTRSACQRSCGETPPAEAPKKPPEAAKTECTAPHPVNLHTTGQLAGTLTYGFTTIHTWKSSTEKSSTDQFRDLSGCTVSEHIKYSKIPNPPYGPADGSLVSESGTEERTEEKSATTGKGQDRHRAPAEWIRKPPSEGSYTVTQTYDYKCSGCGDQFVPFAHYLITSKVHKDEEGWKHTMTKVGSGEQAGDSEAKTEPIS